MNHAKIFGFNLNSPLCAKQMDYVKRENYIGWPANSDQYAVPIVSYIGIDLISSTDNN